MEVYGETITGLGPYAGMYVDRCSTRDDTTFVRLRVHVCLHGRQFLCQHIFVFADLQSNIYIIEGIEIEFYDMMDISAELRVVDMHVLIAFEV